MPPTLIFTSWVRERVGELVTGVEHGRARAASTVTLTGTTASGAVTTSGSRQVRFLLAGPGDVTGLKRGAVVGRYPVPGAIDAETDKCVHVELRDPSLPWRYTPAANPAPGTGTLHAWLALVVGIDGDELTLGEDAVSLGVAVQQLHPLGAPGQASPWAHVQQSEGGVRLARVLSGRALEADTDYLAVLVPAFRAEGAGVVRSWTGAAPVTLPVLDRWRFRTAASPGSFRTLAGRLQPGQANPDTGRAPVDYPRLPEADDLEVRGAMAPLGATDAPLPTAVADDLAALATPATDEAGRPVVGLPHYGEGWHADPAGTTTWGATLNGDPRFRGSAGIGLEMGIRLQDELAADAAAHAGALAVAAQRIRFLHLGLVAAGSLWQRRLPTDPLRQLWLLGPALRRVVTDDGPLADLVTADDRALPRGIFSSAARRILRPGPARTALLDGGARAVDPAVVLPGVNGCPEPADPRPDGLPDLDRIGSGDLFERLREVLERGELVDHTAEGLERLDLSGLHQRLSPALEELRERFVTHLQRGNDDGPWAAFTAVVAAAFAADPRDDEEAVRLLRLVEALLESFPEPADRHDDLLRLVGELLEEPDPEPRCRPVDLGALADGVVRAFDPTRSDAPARVRVLSTISGLDPAQPLTPPEVCVGLDRPVWRDLNEAFPEWLLPGVGDLPEDAVIAVETNPVFTDALMVGYNTQLLGELRWRNLPIATGCTPLRVFWERADTGTGDRIDDITGIAGWPANSDLGAPAHRPGGAAGRDLVLVFRGQLFLRYPKTLLYLVSAVHGGTTRYDLDPVAGASRALPSFQGRIGADVTFFGFQGVVPDDISTHWVVLEEPPAGYRFYNASGETPPPGGDGAAFADDTFADPVRVLIRGDRLAPSS